MEPFGHFRSFVAGAIVDWPPLQLAGVTIRGDYEAWETVGRDRFVDLPLWAVHTAWSAAWRDPEWRRLS